MKEAFSVHFWFLSKVILKVDKSLYLRFFFSYSLILFGLRESTFEIRVPALHSTDPKKKTYLWSNRRSVSLRLIAKTMWFIGVEVEQETSAPPHKKNRGSAPAHSTIVHQQTLTVRIPWQFLKNNLLFVLAESIACVQKSSIYWRVHAGNSILGIYPFDSRNQKWLKMGLSSCLSKISGLAFNVSAFST